jgi:hypothetical protein
MMRGYTVLLAALTVSSVPLLLSTASAQSRSVGRVTAVLDQVEVWRDGRARPAATGMEIFEKDVVRTGPLGRARIEFNRPPEEREFPGGVVNIGSNTEVVVNPVVPKFEGGAIDLIGGVLRKFLRGWSERGSKFVVRVGTSICGIRGTEFVIVHDRPADVTDVLLHEGALACTAQASGALTLEAGQRVRVERGVAGPIRPLDERAWTAALAAVGEEDASAPLADGYWVYRLSGSGYQKAYGGSSYFKSGYHLAVLQVDSRRTDTGWTLSGPRAFSDIVAHWTAQLRKEMIGECERGPAALFPPPPHIWVGGPTFEIVGGPYATRQEAERAHGCEKKSGSRICLAWTSERRKFAEAQQACGGIR